MALPSIRAISRLARVTVEGPSWSTELYRELNLEFGRVEDPELSVLFKPSFSAAWAARKAPVRVGHATDHRTVLLTHPVVLGSGHRAESYAALLRVLGVRIWDDPTYFSTAQERASVEDLPRESVLLLPGTASPRTVRWRGFLQLSEHLGDRAVVAGGPGDESVLSQFASSHRVLPAMSLGMFGAIASRVGAVVGNDSGLTHLAAAARRAEGCPLSSIVVVYGSTEPGRTGPKGTTAIHGPRPRCWPCYRKWCARLTSPCLGAPVDPVIEALERALARGEGRRP
jgi:ADP-heptose:LPS heptosyltransferase